MSDQFRPVDSYNVWGGGKLNEYFSIKRWHYSYPLAWIGHRHVSHYCLFVFLHDITEWFFFKCDTVTEYEPRVYPSKPWWVRMPSNNINWRASALTKLTCIFVGRIWRKNVDSNTNEFYWGNWDEDYWSVLLNEFCPKSFKRAELLPMKDWDISFPALDTM